MHNIENKRSVQLKAPERQQSQNKGISLISAGVLALTTFVAGCNGNISDNAKAQKGKGNCIPTEKNNDLTDNEKLAVQKYSEYKKLRTNREDLFESFRLADEALLNGSKCSKLMEEIKNTAKKELDHLEK